MVLRETTRARLQVLVMIVTVLAVVVVLVWWIGRRKGPSSPPVNANEPAEGRPSLEASPVASASSPTPETAATPEATLPEQLPDLGLGTATPTPETNQGTARDTTLGDSFVGTLKLIVPVTGVRPDQLLDTFSDARSEGRVHDAIDIPAPAGAPVLAAADGEIVRLFQSERGGITIYQLSADKKLIFYYAHLQRYADGLATGKFVKQGEVIAFVGDTGNAGAGNYHLHFSVAVLSDPKRYWGGTSINPYPLLRK